MQTSANPQKSTPLYSISNNERQNNCESQSPGKQSMSPNQANSQNIAQLNKTWSGAESQDRYIHYLRDQISCLKKQLSWKESELNSDANHKSLYPPQFNFSFAQAQYSRLLGEFREVKEELDNLKKDAEEKVDKSNKEIQNLQKQNEELQAENQKLKDELEKAKQDAKERDELSKTKSDEVSKLNEKAKAEKKELQNEIKKLKSQLDEAQKVKTKTAPILPKKAAKEEKVDAPATTNKSSKKDNIRHKSVERSPKVTKDKEIAAHKRKRNKSESNDKRKSQVDRNEKDIKNEKEEKEERRKKRHRSEKNNDDGEINENKKDQNERKENVKERDVDVSASNEKSNKDDDVDNKNKEHTHRKRSPSPSREKDKLNAREIKLLKSALKAQTEGNKDLEERIKTQEDTIRDLKMELVLVQLQKDELKSNNEQLKTRNETSQNEVDHVLKLFNNQTLESKQLSTEVAKLRDDLETKEQVITRLKSNVINARKLEKRINKLENENETLNSKNRLLEYENTSLKDMLSINKDSMDNNQQPQLCQVQQQQFQQPYQQRAVPQQQNIKQSKKRSTKNEEDSDDSFLRKNEKNVKELIQRIENLSDKFNKDSQRKSKQIDELGKKVISLRESQNELAKNIESKTNT